MDSWKVKRKNPTGLALEIKLLEKRFKYDIVGRWSSEYYSWCPPDQNMTIYPDGTGEVSSMIFNIKFKWEQLRKYSMKVWDVQYLDEKDTSPKPEIHVVAWRFMVCELHNGVKRVELNFYSDTVDLLIMTGVVRTGSI